MRPGRRRVTPRLVKKRPGLLSILACLDERAPTVERGAAGQTGPLWNARSARTFRQKLPWQAVFHCRVVVGTRRGLAAALPSERERLYPGPRRRSAHPQFRDRRRRPRLLLETDLSGPRNA